jgi:hypothetical protein
MGSEDARATERLGTLGWMDSVMAALFAEIEEGGMATPPWPPFRAPTLGVPTLTVARLLEVVDSLSQPRRDPGEGAPGRVLDSQIEAQVHGPIELYHDVERLVRYGIVLRWHPGFRLAVESVPDDFRGPAMPRLARRIAGQDGMVDAAVIGRAEASLRRQPDAWRDWGSHAEALQHLRQLWHVLVHCGLPARSSRA